MDEHAQAKAQIENEIAAAMLRAGDPDMKELLPHIITMNIALIDAAASLRVLAAHQSRILMP